MDWRNNMWVAVGAAGLLVVGVVFMVWYLGDSGSSVLEQAVGLTFKCDTCEELFTVAQVELKDFDTYMTYLNKYAEAVPCRKCGAETAYQVYWCKECNRHYKYTKGQGVSQFTFCPERHEILTEDE